MRTWYANRSPRDRRVLAIVAGVAAALLLLALGLQAQRSRDRVAAELPALRASIKALEQGAEEAKRLRALPAAQPGAATPLASLATNAGGVAGAQVSVLDERRVRLAGADVNFATLLEWLGAARATHGMRVESARIEALAAPGRVRAEMVLARP